MDTIPPISTSLFYWLKEKNYKDALKSSQTAKKFNPFDVRIEKILTAAQLATDHSADAKENLTALSSKFPTDIFIHKALGLAHIKEKAYTQAIGEFTTIKNLAPNDHNGLLLLSAAYTLNNDHSKALEKIDKIKDRLVKSEEKEFLDYLIEKNSPPGEALEINNNLATNNLISLIENMLLEKEINQIDFILEFENPIVSKRLAEKLKKEKQLGIQNEPAEEKAPRLLDYKGTVVENFEFYDRTTKGASPINAMNVTSNVKVEGTTESGVELTAEVETFFNRWDNHTFDFFKINATKRDDFEIDVGKFSAKHFPSLVSYPSVEEGVRLHKKLARAEFEKTNANQIIEDGETPINLGEIYRENHIDSRINRDIELTVVLGRTKRAKNIDDRKEKNEGSYETSGQIEQWTQSYRLHSQVNSVLEVGTSLSIVQDSSRKATVSSTTYPIESSAISIDGGIDLLDNALNIDGEIAYGNYDLNTLDFHTKHERDFAWLFKSKYKIFDSLSFSYEQKNIGRNFKVEGASQTQDKLTHSIEFAYKPLSPKTWLIKSQTFTYKPDFLGQDGGGDSKKYYETFQSVTEIKLPKDAKYTLDYKYYLENDKCDCSDYRTLTFKNSLECNFPSIKTKIKPSYTFERKDDNIASPTDEKKSEYVLTIENTSIKNLELDYSVEREVKRYYGATTKKYHQFIHSLEAKYTFIPSRLDMKIKIANDFKHPTDTNKTDISTATFELNYTSKAGDDKFNLKYERKDNVYLPWSDSSAYRQNYVNLKYTRQF